MIALIILAGIYAILAVGYFKMVRNAIPDFAKEAPVLIGFVSLIWPVAIVYTLAKESLT